MKAIVNAKVVYRDDILEGYAVLFENGVICGLVEQNALDPLRPEERIDAGGCTVGPGFVDIHCHAGGPVWCHEDPVYVANHHLSGGTTSLVCTLYHNIGTRGTIAGGKKIKETIRAGTPGNLVGIHFEGPYLSGKYGADSGGARTPDAAEYGKYLELFGDIIRQWTYSPEVAGTAAFARTLRKAGVTAAIGHSQASPEQVREAVKNGARICTHLTNATGTAISPTRYPGTLEVSFDVAVMLHSELFCEVICDSGGVHIRADMMRFIRQAVGINRMVAITDACASGGSGDVNIVDGEVFGSALTMRSVAKNFRALGFSIPDIFKLCAQNPARAIGLFGAGTIEAGKQADFVFLDCNMELRKVVLKGKTVRES